MACGWNAARGDVALVAAALNAREEDVLIASMDIRTDIAAGNTRFRETFGRGDAAGVAALYTTGGQLLPPNSPVIAGRDAIQAFWNTSQPAPAK